MLVKNITIQNKLGLHARAAAKFVATATRYGSQINVRKDNQIVNGKSIMGIMTLAASKGTILEITVEGDDEMHCLQDIETLINNKFNEES